MSNQATSTATFELHVTDRLKLRGKVRVVEDGKAKPVVVLAHGFRGFQDWGFWPEVAERLAATGDYAITFDYSRITAWEEGLEEPAVAAASTVSQDLSDLSVLFQALHASRLPLSAEADASRTTLLGHSRSGGSAVIYASEQPSQVAAVVIWNGGASPVHDLSDPDLTPVQRAVALDQQANAERFAVDRRFVLLEQPALIVQGDRDREALLDFVNGLKEAAPHQTYVFVPRGDHTFGVAHPLEGVTPELEAAYAATLDFLDEHFRSETGRTAQGA